MPARLFYANDNHGDKYYKGLTQPGCLFDVFDAMTRHSHVKLADVKYILDS